MTKLSSRNARQIIDELEEDKRTHESRGFRIKYFHGDNESKIHSLRDSLRPSRVHIYVRDEHVGFIEKAISTVKEITLSLCHAITYKKYTSIMKQYLVEGLVELLNYSPSKNSVTKKMIL